MKNTWSFPGGNTRDLLRGTTYLQIAAITAAIWLLYVAAVRVYRIYLHPLADFKGPRAAAVSRQWLFDQTKTPSPEAIFEQMHHQYATRALRIGPNELHLTDPSLYKVIYSQTHPLQKEFVFYNYFGLPHTLFAETDPALHRVRRKLLNPLFSRNGILKLEDLVASKVHELSAKIESWGANTSVAVNHAFKSMTTDIISSFAFDSCTNLISAAKNPRFESAILQAVDNALSTAILMPFKPLAVWLRRIVPEHWVARFNSDIEVLVDFQDSVSESVKTYHRKAAGPDKQRPYPVLFDYLTGLSEKDEAAEAQDLLVAGSDTTALTLTVALFHVLHKPDIHRKLRDILDEKIPDKDHIPSLSELEKLEYLRCVVKESLRLAMPVPGRLPRIVRETAQPLTVDGQVIPPGTIVGMSAYSVHRSPEVWGPNVLEFVPERWTGEDSKGLDQYLVSFGKGARMCLGMNLAYAELTMALAYFFRFFDMQVESNEILTKDSFTAILRDQIMVQFTARK